MKLSSLNILQDVNLSNNEIDMLINMYENKQQYFSDYNQLKAEVKFLAALTFFDTIEEMEDFVKNDLKMPSFNSKNRTFEEIKKLNQERLDLLLSLGILEKIDEKKSLSN
jgi:hypothetical protein